MVNKKDTTTMLPALKLFAESLTAKFDAHAPGEDEDQLKPPVDALLKAFGDASDIEIVAKGESKLDGRLGRPDFAILADKLPVGHVELKAPGKGANPKTFKGHDQKQWKRFKQLPNLIYTDGTEWALYREGQLIGKRVRFTGDAHTDAATAVEEDDAKAFFHLLAEFSAWKPIVPKSPRKLAEFLAPYCRWIRSEVLDALEDTNSPIQDLKKTIKDLLFPEADDDQFADSYAQTVIFALLLARIEGANCLDLNASIEKLASSHSLLSRSLEFLTDREAQKEIATSLSMAQRVINEVSPTALAPKKDQPDPWLYFYEHFLAEYDPKLRKDAGAYYTPVQVVRAQVRLIDEILTDKLGHEMGFVDPGVITLDPAVGTGTYLLGIIEHALARVRKEEGDGAVRGAARLLSRNLHGFEWLVGPYSVAQLRFTQAITEHGSSLPADGPGIYLTNTLESPHTNPPAPPLFHKPIAREHERALKVKDAENVLVILGNPPYDRHAKHVPGVNDAITGGWVRHGDKTDQTTAAKQKPILEDFIAPARDAGHGVHIKNLYNLYTYFLRWSLWKIFEHKTATGPGVLSFITAASYLDGGAFSGIREHMRRVCDHIDIIDLGGEGRGTRQDDNVFAIKTPVCICVAYRTKQANRDLPATVRYTRIEGSRDEKINTLEAVHSANDLKWQDVTSGWQDAFMPESTGKFTKWPSLTDIFPWQNNGVKAGRTWVVSPDKESLTEKLKQLLIADISDKAKFFKNSPTGCNISDSPLQLPPNRERLNSIETLKSHFSESVTLAPYSYRSFDRQYVVADARFLDRAGPSLWLARSNKQIYLTSLFSTSLGEGPGTVACSEIPDLDCFRGSYGAKAVIPLYRNATATIPNLLPGLIDYLSERYPIDITPEDIAGYVYGILAQPAYTKRFADELERREVRIPWTADAELFEKVATFGRRLIWLQTYGERCIPEGEKKGVTPKGEARCTVAVPDSEADYPETFEYDADKQELRVGSGVFAPVASNVWKFNVSGLNVVRSWLGYRMKVRSGKKSSPLDEIRPQTWTHTFTRELLELLWVLEETLAGYPEQQSLLEDVLAGELLPADTFPEVPNEARKSPSVPKPKKTKQSAMDFLDTDAD